VRFPAYCNGIAGIRPTMGRAPGFNATAVGERPLTAQLMAVQGPLARHVRDLRIGLAAMSGRDARDAWWVPAPLQGPAPARPIKVAMVTASPGLYVHPDVANAIRIAANALVQAGYIVEEVQPPSIEDATNLWAKLVVADTRHLVLDTVEKLGDDGVRKAIGLWFEIVQDVTVREYILASAEVLKHRRAWNLFMEGYPLVLGPNSGDLPFKIGFDTKDVEGTRHVFRSQALMTAVNMLGLPSAAVPVGTIAAPDAPRGVPVGVQIIAPRYREDLALDAAEAIEGQLGLPTPIDPVW
jgi:amidase